MVSTMHYIFYVCMYTVSQKNNIDVAHYKFNSHQPILVIFGTDVAVRVHYQNLFLIQPFLTNVSALPWET